MTQIRSTNEHGRPASNAVQRLMTLSMIGATLALGGCINVTAPDKPIVINLNINITQQVVYKLDGQAKELIQGNPDIF
jgi:hypothetical protein